MVASELALTNNTHFILAKCRHYATCLIYVISFNPLSILCSRYYPYFTNEEA